MSCIQKLLKLKGNKEFLPISFGAVMEDGGRYKGYDYCVTFIDLGHRCGYVALPGAHKYLKEREGKDLGEYDHEIDAHGEITFFDKPGKLIEIFKPHCDDIWIGFDAGHWGDAKDLGSLVKYFKSNEEAYDMHRFFQKCNFLTESVKDKEFMVEECKSIIEQLEAKYD